MVSTEPGAGLSAKLEDLGFRMTGPRRRVADFLSHKAEAFSAEEVNAELTGVGRATVYRTIRLLVDAGVLCKAVMLDGTPRYSFDDARHHHHVICIGCGQVQEFRKPAVERLLREMAADVPGRPMGHRVELYVMCPACLDGGAS